MELREENIRECLISQDDKIREAYHNGKELAREFRVKGFITNKRKPDTKLVVAEVSPALRKIMVDRRIFVGWGSALVVDHLEVMQCYRCYEFGHKSDRCSAKQPKCGRCGEDHDQRKCESDKVRCTSCATAGLDNHNHEAIDRNCPTRKRILENIKRSIDYGL